MLAHKLRRSSGGAFELSYVTSATSTSDTITWPAVSAGDIAVFIQIAVNSSGTPTSVIGSGFTACWSPGAYLTTTLYRISAKVCTGTESGSLTGMNGTAGDEKLLLIFSSNGFATSLTPSTWDGAITTTEPSSKTASASGGTAPLIVIGASRASGGAPNFTTESPEFDDEVLGVTAFRAGYSIYNIGDTLSDHTIDTNDFGDNNMISIGYLEIS